MGAKNIYIATPVMDLFSYESLLQISDGIFCPHRIRDYISIEYYYENLGKPEFSELERILENYE
jgi:putative phosphoribosyl transferase